MNIAKKLQYPNISIKSDLLHNISVDGQFCILIDNVKRINKIKLDKSWQNFLLCWNTNYVLSATIRGKNFQLKIWKNKLLLPEIILQQFCYYTVEVRYYKEFCSYWLYLNKEKHWNKLCAFLKKVNFQIRTFRLIW